MRCEQHLFIVVEAEGSRDSWRAHRLMCQKCQKLVFFKEILKNNSPKTVKGEVIDIN